MSKNKQSRGNRSLRTPAAQGMIGYEQIDEEFLFALLRERMERAVEECDPEFFSALDQMLRSVLRTVNPAFETFEHFLDQEKTSSSLDAA